MISIHDIPMIVALSLFGTFLAMMIFPTLRRRVLAFVVRRAAALVHEFRGRASVFGKGWSVLKGFGMLGASLAVVGTLGFGFLIAGAIFAFFALQSDEKHPPAGTFVGGTYDGKDMVADGHGGYYIAD